MIWVLLSLLALQAITLVVSVVAAGTGMYWTRRSMHAVNQPDRDGFEKRMWRWYVIAVIFAVIAMTVSLFTRLLIMLLVPLSI